MSGARLAAPGRAMAAGLAIVVALALGAGCGRKAKVVAPDMAVLLPPHVTGVFPAARSGKIDYDTAIWARFDEPLDSTTVNTTNIYLKIDTRRIPIDVALVDTARRVVLRPRQPLDIRRTHTIEITPRVRTRAGHGFKDTFFWQFTTLSVRRIETPVPGAGATGRSPMEPLLWDSTETSAGPIQYRLYVGTDSSQVAAGAAHTEDLVRSWYLPTIHWDPGTPWYWKVRVQNEDTGDESTGPVWRFDVHDATAIDSLTLTVGNNGTWDKNFRVWRCATVTSGASYGPETQFDFSGVDSGLVVAGAKLRLQTSSRIDPARTFPQVWEISQPWIPCNPSFATPPAADPPLADGFKDADGNMAFQSDLLAAQIQARVRRYPQFHDYTFRSGTQIVYNPLVFGTGFRIYYYVPTPPLARARTAGRHR